jgi:hypothetical protein
MLKLNDEFCQKLDLLDGKEHVYAARPLIQERLAQLSRGQSATLLVDAEQKVTDVAFRRRRVTLERSENQVFKGTLGKPGAGSIAATIFSMHLTDADN